MLSTLEKVFRYGFSFYAFPQGEKRARVAFEWNLSYFVSDSSERPRCERDERHVTAILHFNGALGWRPGTHQSLASNSGWRFPHLTDVTVGNIMCFVFFFFTGWSLLKWSVEKSSQRFCGGSAALWSRCVYTLPPWEITASCTPLTPLGNNSPPPTRSVSLIHSNSPLTVSPLPSTHSLLVGGHGCKLIPA